MSTGGIKEIYDEWNEKVHPYHFPMDFQSYLEDVNSDLMEMEAIITEAGLDSSGYLDQMTAIHNVVVGVQLLNNYIMSLIPEIQSRLDDPLFQVFTQDIQAELESIRGDLTKS